MKPLYCEIQIRQDDRPFYKGYYGYIVGFTSSDKGAVAVVCDHHGGPEEVQLHCVKVLSDIGENQ